MRHTILTKCQNRALVVILHSADKIRVHLAWRRRIAIVVHQFVSYDFVQLILDGLKRYDERNMEKMREAVSKPENHSDHQQRLLWCETHRRQLG
jgi:hypothetical protein